jgi:outer membrane protein OmpA-like peptidoglycan-associated protein
MWTEQRKDRLRATSLIFVFTTVVVFIVAVLAARLSAQTPQPRVLPVTSVTATRQFAQGEEAKIKGLITSRSGDDMVIRDENGAIDIVTLTNDTKISSPGGLFNLEKRPRDVSNLLPGLIVEVKGMGDDRGKLVADKISFHSSALRVAEQIAAGTVSLRMSVRDSLSAMNKRALDSLDSIRDSMAAMEARARDSLGAIGARFDNIDNYDVRQTSTVFFATNQAELTDDGKRTLDALAASAATQDGYLIEVRGYADSRGSEAHNLLLSSERADAVVDYLVREKNVPIRRLLNPTGFGEEDPAASNATAAGRAQNRRAEVKVLINRAVR